MAIITPTIIKHDFNNIVFKFVFNNNGDVTSVPFSRSQNEYAVTGTGICTFSAANKTITRTTGSWIIDGVHVGDYIATAANSTGTNVNVGPFIIKEVTPLTLTIETNTSIAVNFLVDEVFDNMDASVFVYGTYLKYGQIYSATNAAVLVTNFVTSVAFSQNIVSTGITQWESDEQSNLKKFYNILGINFANAASGGTVIMECKKISGWTGINPEAI